MSFRRSFAIVALLLAIPTVAERLLLPRAEQSLLALLSIVTTFGFDTFIIVVIFRRVFGSRKPDTETIFGALCIYLLVGFSFAGLYSMLAAVQPGAFHMDSTANIRSVPDRFDLIYYSFGTMTSLGAAGITAVSDQARSLSVIEAVLGILYLAVLISRLMGAYQADSGEQ